MKNKILLILLIIFQSSFAQNEIFDKIKCVNKNMANGLEVSDTVFKNILVSLEPINNIFIDKINDSLNLKSEIVYYPKEIPEAVFKLIENDLGIVVKMSGI